MVQTASMKGNKCGGRGRTNGRTHGQISWPVSCRAVLQLIKTVI